MKIESILRVIRSLALIALVAFPAGAAFAQAGSTKDFCWRDSYGRGVGAVPKSCAPGKEMIGLLCYTKCPKGMKRVGFDCHSVCPDGMRDDGLFCRKAEYGRGAGYPWKFGDKAFSLAAAKSRCEKGNGKGNCEKTVEIYYPKCKSGYKNFGCCICRPTKPNCRALGLNNGIDLSCAKKVSIGDPRVGTCPAGQQNDAGLCYPNCRSGYKGVGPVCWAKAPPKWVECGMGSAKDSKTCASKVLSQVSSVGQLAIFVASLGSSSTATSGAKSAQSAGKLAKLKAE